MSRVRTSCSIVVVGAGPCGLSGAYHLERAGCDDYLLIERSARVGGLARTETFDGFSFDHAIHILYTSDPYAADLIANEMLPGRLRRQRRRSYCYSSGVFTEYPYQANQHGLPARIVVDNLLGLIEAGIRSRFSSPARSFEELLRARFGAGIARNFMLPYNRKQWAWDLADMDYDWIADRLPIPRLWDVLGAALRPPSRRYGPNREFWYPEHGGIQALAEAFLELIPPERFVPGRAVESIDLAGHLVTLDDGTEVSYTALLSTMPLTDLVRLAGEQAPAEIQASAADLKSNTVYTVNIGLEGLHLGPCQAMHWVYFPGDETIFHRLSFPASFSDAMTPDGCVSIQAEVSASPYRPIDPARLVDETLASLVRVGILQASEARSTGVGGRIRVCEVVALEPAYVIYDHSHRDHTTALKAFFRGYDVLTRGRFGEWEYLNMDHAIMSGKRAAEELGSMLASRTRGALASSPGVSSPAVS